MTCINCIDLMQNERSTVDDKLEEIRKETVLSQYLPEGNEENGFRAKNWTRDYQNAKECMQRLNATLDLVLFICYVVVEKYATSLAGFNHPI